MTYPAYKENACSHKYCVKYLEYEPVVCEMQEKAFKESKTELLRVHLKIIIAYPRKIAFCEIDSPDEHFVLIAFDRYVGLYHKVNKARRNKYRRRDRRNENPSVLGIFIFAAYKQKLAKRKRTQK
jgi:hypothetical protein